MLTKYKNLMVIITIIFVEIAIWAETDMFVPSMPDIVNYYRIEEKTIQLMLSINFLGLFISALSAGPISDFYGRRKIMLAGMLIFIFSSLGCAVSKYYNILLLFRFIQGIGAGIPMALAWVVIIDLFDEKKVAYISGLISSCTTAVMAGAPILGGIISSNFLWQTNFYVIGFFSLLVLAMVITFLFETHPPKKRTSLSIKNIFTNYLDLIKRPYFTGNVLIVSLGYSCIMIYISNISIIFINHLNISQKLFSYLQASTMITYMIGSAISSKLISIYNMRNTNYIGGSMIAIGSFLLFLNGLFLPDQVFLICIFMNIFTAGVSISINIIGINAMKDAGTLKGTAASFFTVTRLIIISFLIQIASEIFNGSITPITNIIFAITLILFLIYISLIKIGVSIEKN